MAAYYNEFDANAAAWLRELIKAGMIADGDVDERSITDVRGDDLLGYDQCHFFAGIGGWSHALRLAGWPDDRPVWTGSCPCQPFSAAGQRRGFDDERHLWPVWRSLIAECRPAVVLGEQVASATQWLGLVRGDLEALGYAVGAIPLEAASAGAYHKRDRFWFVADATGERSLSSALAGVHCGEEGAGPWHGQPERCGSGSLADGDRPRRQPGIGNDTPARHRNSAAAAGEPVRGSLADSDCAGPQGWGVLPERAGECAAGQDGVGNAESFGWRGWTNNEAGRGGEFSSADTSAGGWITGADGKARRLPEPGIRLLAHGVSARVAKLRGFGNAIDPRPAAAFIRAVM